MRHTFTALGALLFGACASEPDAPDRRKKTVATLPTEVVPPQYTGAPDIHHVGELEGLLQHGQVPCAEPELRDTLGPMYEADLGPQWAVQRSPALDPSEDIEAGAGLVVADLTGDGLLDIFLPNLTQCLLFVGQPDGTLVDESADRIPKPEAACKGWGASAADYDQDGDLDLYLAREGARDAIWRNGGNGRFTELQDEVGLSTLHCASRSATWGDMDGDGDLDLFVARHRKWDGESQLTCPDLPVPYDWSLFAGDPNELYENLGDGTFLERSDELPQNLYIGHAFIAPWRDVDLDGDLDLYVINDFGARAAPTNVFLNDGTGTFTTMDPALGLWMRVSAMGLGIGDLNEDGFDDYVVAEVNNFHAMYASPTGDFWYDTSTATGLLPAVFDGQKVAWATEVVDMDNDTLLDVVSVFGPTEEPLNNEMSTDREQADGVWLQDAQGNFTDVAPEWGVANTTMGRGLVVADLNGDGWLDLARTDYRTGPAHVYYARCGEASWLEVSIAGPNDGFHSRVDVRIGDRILSRTNAPGNSGMASSGPSGVHFGLGDAEVVDELTITWADGTVRTFTDVPARQRVTAYQNTAPTGAGIPAP